MISTSWIGFTFSILLVFAIEKKSCRRYGILSNQIIFHCLERSTALVSIPSNRVDRLLCDG